MMGKSAAALAAPDASLPCGSRDRATVRMVCLALLLALLVLGFRIASFL
jgi:hypothetical protein